MNGIGWITVAEAARLCGTDELRIPCRPVQPQPGRHHLRGRGATAGQARQTGQAPPPARHPARRLRLVAAHRPGVPGAGCLHRGAPARPPPPLPLLPPVLCPQLRQRIGSRDPPAAPAGRLDRRRQPTGFQGLVPVIPAIFTIFTSRLYKKADLSFP